jgi:hypothetical protein
MFDKNEQLHLQLEEYKLSAEGHGQCCQKQIGKRGFSFHAGEQYRDRKN